MAIVKGGWWEELLRPRLAFQWFCLWYGPRKRYERRKKYEARRDVAYREWIAKLPDPESYQ